jgi:hypothetical protein
MLKICRQVICVQPLVVSVSQYMSWLLKIQPSLYPAWM